VFLATCTLAIGMVSILPTTELLNVAKLAVVSGISTTVAHLREIPGAAIWSGGDRSH